MSYRIINRDQLAPSQMLARLGETNYFADTRVMVRAARWPTGAIRVFVHALDDAFVPGKVIPVFGVDFSEAADEQVADETERFFCRFPRAVDLLKSLQGVDWVYSKEQEAYDSFRTPRGVLLCRTAIPGEFVWSPFARIEPLSKGQTIWAPELVARAAHCGQFSKCVSKTVDRLDASKGEDDWTPMDGLELARSIINDTTHSWTSKVVGSKSETVELIRRIKQSERYQLVQFTPDYLV